MGREARTEINDGQTKAPARLHLDSQTLTIGPPFRLKLDLADLSGIVASEAGLSFRAPDGGLKISLPAKEAAAWAKAMSNPPSLAQKLGLKPGMTIATLGDLPAEITAILPGERADRAELIFAAVPGDWNEAWLRSVVKKLAPKAAVWLVYRKGQTNGDTLLYAARDEGLKDSKVARISDTYAALRFVAKP